MRCFFQLHPPHRTKIPATLADRFAHLNHGFTGRCSDFAIKPPPCQWGSDDAQSAAAWSHVGLSAFLLLLNPVLGSWSDRHGRRRVILFSLAVSIVPAIVFLVLLQDPTMHPAWYYVRTSIEMTVEETVCGTEGTYSIVDCCNIGVVQSYRVS